MFFVGPRNSSLLVFKTIAKEFGWYASTILYIPTVCLGAFIIFLPSYYYAKRKFKEQSALPEKAQLHKIS
jgi:hypothetical protein